MGGTKEEDSKYGIDDMAVVSLFKPSNIRLVFWCPAPRRLSAANNPSCVIEPELTSFTNRPPREWAMNSLGTYAGQNLASMICTPEGLGSQNGTYIRLIVQLAQKMKT